MILSYKYKLYKTKRLKKLEKYNYWKKVISQAIFFRNQKRKIKSSSKLKNKVENYNKVLLKEIFEFDKQLDCNKVEQ
jgi:hypothetical protein